MNEFIRSIVICIYMVIVIGIGSAAMFGWATMMLPIIGSGFVLTTSTFVVGCVIGAIVYWLIKTFDRN